MFEIIFLFITSYMASLKNELEEFFNASDMLPSEKNILTRALNLLDNIIQVFPNTSEAFNKYSSEIKKLVRSTFLEDKVNYILVYIFHTSSFIKDLEKIDINDTSKIIELAKERIYFARRDLEDINDYSLDLEQDLWKILAIKLGIFKDDTSDYELEVKKYIVTRGLL